MIKIGKLVRDKMADIIKSDGYIPHCVAIEPRHMQRALESKLVEEVGEYIREPSLGEIVDIVEVALGLAMRQGANQDDVMRAVFNKRQERGAFKHGVFLIGVDAP